MTRTLVLKLLRDVRLGLLAVAVLLMLFQLLWARITHTVTTDLLKQLSARTNLPPKVFVDVFFQKEGQIVQKLIGAGAIDITQPFHLLTAGYVHALIQTILCVWAIGRAAGAVSGEIDRGTMELLLAQPLRPSPGVPAPGI